jgi:hypothetical protein
MKNSIFSLSLLAFVANASAQGLLGVLPKSAEDVETKPISFGVGVVGGWDSNVNTSSENETDSFFLGGSLSADYRYVTDRTVISLGANGGANYYLDQIDPYDDVLYNGRISGSLTHAISDRLSIDDKFYVGFESEPNYIFGSSLNRRSDEYFFGYNDFSVNYLWTDRISTSTSFSVQATDYDTEDVFASAEDRISFGARQLVRYALSEQTGLRAEYRYEFTDYDSGIEATRNHALVGFDHALDENTMILGMAGVEFYDNDSGDNTKPYAELGISRILTDALSVRWANRLGFEDTGIGVYDSNYTFRTNLDLNYQMAEKIGSYAGISYLYTDYEGTLASDTQNLIEGRVGLSYDLSAALSLFLQYSYTNLDSDVENYGFDRQRISVGVNATF